MDNDNNLTGLSRYIYGTGSLGIDSIPWQDRKAIAKEALTSTGWIHTSHQYGDTLKVLREVYDEDRSLVRPTIFKIGWNSVEEVRGQVELHLEALGIESMAIGQLCPGGELADAIRTGDSALDGLRKMRDQGLVGRYVMEVWPWTSDVAFEALSEGHVEGLIEGFIFYLNPLQRFVSNPLWDLIQANQFPIIAMRTVSGGDVNKLIDDPNARDYIRERAGQVKPIFQRSGISSWTEFAARFSLGLPLVRATVGATSKSANLREFIEFTTDPMPLPEQTTKELLALQRRWADEYDSKAEAWTM